MNKDRVKGDYQLDSGGFSTYINTSRICPGQQCARTSTFLEMAPILKQIKDVKLKISERRKTCLMATSLHCVNTSIFSKKEEF